MANIGKSVDHLFDYGRVNIERNEAGAAHDLTRKSRRPCPRIVPYCILHCIYTAGKSRGVLEMLHGDFERAY